MEPSTRAAFHCALLNCNGLFSRDGSLHLGFYSFVDALSQGGCDIALLTEPHLPPHAVLPSDQPYSIMSNPSEVGQGQRRRDAAILCGPLSQAEGIERVPVGPSADIVIGVWGGEA